MDFCLTGLKQPLLVVAAGAMVLSAGAQQGGQPIIFSSPPNSAAPSTMPPAAPVGPDFSGLPGTIRAPSSFFDFSPPNDFQMTPPPPVSAAGQQSMKKTLTERKNWMQMTPEEMLGVAPADKDNAPEEPDSQTPLERFFDQEKQPQAAPKGDGQNDRENSAWDFPRDRNSAEPFESGRDGADNPGRNPSGLSSDPWDNNNDAPADKNDTLSWDSFSAPAPQAPEKPSLEQLAAMDRFRQLLTPSPAPATESSENSKLFSAPITPIDPNFTQPPFVPNPAGASFTPLSSGIGMPTGLTPLPGVVTPIMQPAVAPSWAPQPAPWLSQAPQPFAIPQRKF
jgi:hypothetical protein